MRKRQEQRAAELVEIRSKTRSLLRTFETSESAPARPQTSWLANKVLRLDVVDVGVAFPLAPMEEPLKPELSARASISLPAFIVSISRISFVTQRSTIGTAKIENLSFQFVKR
jgi:hypothetical protein